MSLAGREFASSPEKMHGHSVVFSSSSVHMHTSITAQSLDG